MKLNKYFSPLKKWRITIAYFICTLFAFWLYFDLDQKIKLPGGYPKTPSVQKNANFEHRGTFSQDSKIKFAAESKATWRNQIEILPVPKWKKEILPHFPLPPHVLQKAEFYQVDGQKTQYLFNFYDLKNRIKNTVAWLMDYAWYLKPQEHQLALQELWGMLNSLDLKNSGAEIQAALAFERWVHYLLLKEPLPSFLKLGDLPNSILNQLLQPEAHCYFLLLAYEIVERYHESLKPFFLGKKPQAYLHELKPMSEYLCLDWKSFAK